MSGLSLICNYDSEESEPEDSEKLKKPKLPTPNLSKVAVVRSEEYIDNPLVHGGRVRSFPHERGNWATFVYIQYPVSDSLINIIQKLANVLTSSGIPCQVCDNIHISLSKTFVLKFHMITPFTRSLQEILSDCDSLELDFNSLEIYCNEDCTRTFVALKVDIYSNRQLTRLTEKIDSILEDYKLPTFYEDPSFHMSVLDINGNKKDEILSKLDELNEIFHKEEKNLETVIISKIDCKSGNKYFQYYLK